MNSRFLALGCFLSLIVPACAAEPLDVATDGEAETTASAAAASVSAQLSSLKLTFDNWGSFETREGARVFVLRGTSNQNLDNTFSYVPDDAYGEAHIVAPRKLEIVLREGSELNTMLSGLPLFVGIQTQTGTTKNFTARLDFAPRFYNFSGSSALYLLEELRPVYVVQSNGNNLLYRGDVETTAQTLAVTGGSPTVTRQDADTFLVDWTYDNLQTVLDPATTSITLSAKLKNGSKAQKQARVEPQLVAAALTTGDAYEVWPSPQCSPQAAACFQGMPAGTTDFGRCGSYREVMRCSRP